jgi:hypothetical protein
MIGRQRLGMVASVYWLHAALALGFAWPAARLLGSPLMAHPRGDAVLFDDGAIYLTEVLRLRQPMLTSVAEGMSWLVFLAAYFGLFPLAMLIRAVTAHTPSTLLEHATAALRSFGPMSLLLGVALLATSIGVVVPLGSAALLETKLHTALDDRAADLALLALRLVALATAALIAIVHDLARVALIAGASARAAPHDAPRSSDSAWGAARCALASARAHVAPAVSGYALRWLAAISLVFAGAMLTTRLGVNTPSRFATVTAVHQLIVFALIALRAAWLRFAATLLVDPE